MYKQVVDKKTDTEVWSIEYRGTGNRVLYELYRVR